MQTINQIVLPQPKYELSETSKKKKNKYSYNLPYNMILIQG